MCHDLIPVSFQSNFLSLSTKNTKEKRLKGLYCIISKQKIPAYTITDHNNGLTSLKNRFKVKPQGFLGFHIPKPHFLNSKGDRQTFIAPSLCFAPMHLGIRRIHTGIRVKFFILFFAIPFLFSYPRCLPLSYLSNSLSSVFLSFNSSLSILSERSTF